MDIEDFIKSLGFGSDHKLRFSREIGHAFFSLSLSDKPYSVHETSTDKWHFFNEKGLKEYIEINKFNINC